VDIHIDRGGYAAFKDRLAVALEEQAPTAFGGQPIVRTQRLTTNDGVKWRLADGSWLLVRWSGTEPLVRVYTESTSQELADAAVEVGEGLVRSI
jgi:phosphomannomutase